MVSIGEILTVSSAFAFKQFHQISLSQVRKGMFFRVLLSRNYH